MFLTPYCEYDIYRVVRETAVTLEIEQCSSSYYDQEGTIFASGFKWF